MIQNKSTLVAVVALLLSFIAGASRADDRAATAAAASAAPKSALHEYVAKADDNYRWVKRREGTLLGISYAELILTSQKWKDITWRHQLFVIKPPEVTSSQGLLLIAGGRWRDELAAAPRGDEGLPREAQMLALAAAKLKSPIAVLLHVPQQPIF